MDIIKKVDMKKATMIVIKYFETIHGNLAILNFIVEGVRPNTTEGFFIVKCSFYPSLGSDEKVHYTVKVNIKNGAILDIIKEQKKEEPVKDENPTETKEAPEEPEKEEEI
ncbi:MAG: hypothetical protein KAT37_02255 [Candidatus Aenigmarchaeota archaeon]|nr:hypothetical protein [Candidatus Aenigmarchaeota archaeon]